MQPLPIETSSMDFHSGVPVGVITQNLPAYALFVAKPVIQSLKAKIDAAPATKKIQRKFAMYYSPSNG